MPNFVGVAEFAQMYGCSVRYAQQLIRTGKAPRYYKIGRSVRFRVEDIEAWLNHHVVNPENK